MSVSSVLLTLVSLAAGWLVLLPLARDLRPAVYHLTALPVGLLSWSFVACTAAVTGAGYTPFTVLIGFAIFVGSGYALCRAIVGPEGRPLFAPAWSYAVHAALLTGVAVAASAVHLSVVTVDSWIHYEVFALRLHDVGRFSSMMLSDRNVLIPSILAGDRFLGGNWPNALFPVLAVYMLAWLSFGLREHSLSRTPEPWRTAIAAILVATFVATPVFRFQSIYIHSHMISALYILSTIVLLVEFRHRSSGSGWRACSLAAGLTAAGFVLSRPDGLIYAAVPLAIAAAELAAPAPSSREMRFYFAGLALALVPVYGTAFGSLGLWASGKQSGVVAATGLLAAFSVLALPAGLARIPAGWRPGRAEVLRGVALGALASSLFVYARHPAELDATVGNMLHNLLIYGGYHGFGVSLVAALLATLAFPRLRSKADASIPLVAVILFILLAVPVFSLSYVGELSWADSFTRMTFHWVAVVLLYVGAVVSAALDSLRSGAPLPES